MRIIYLHGFASGPGSKKAQFFRDRFRACGVDLEIPDLAAGDFEHLTLTGQLRLIERLARGEAVSLIGSSMGGYLAALYAARHAEVERVVLLAPAFALSGRWVEWLGEAGLAEWKRNGAMPFLHHADGRERLLSYGIIEDAAQYEDFPAVTQPTLVFHGRQDDAVPYTLSEHFAAGRGNARLTLFDDGHELMASVERIWEGVRGFFGLTGQVQRPW